MFHHDGVPAPIQTASGASIFRLEASNYVLCDFQSISRVKSIDESATMTTDFSGTWKSGRSEGWPELLDKLNIPKEKLPSGLRITQLITQTGDRVNIKTTNNIDDTMRESTVDVGESFTDRAAGYDIEYTTAWGQGGKLVLTRTNGNGSITREIVVGEMLVTHNHEGVIAKSYFTKQ